MSIWSRKYCSIARKGFLTYTYLLCKQFFTRPFLNFIRFYLNEHSNRTNLWCDAIKLPHGAAASDSPSVLWHVSCHMQMILPLRVSWTLMACNRGCSILFLARYWSNRQIACPSHTHKIVFSRLFFWRKKKNVFYGMHATLKRYKNASHSATCIPNLN